MAQYQAVTNQTELLNLIGTTFDATSIEFASMGCTSADFAKIYYFETTTAGVKKRGYIHFISGQAKNNNFVNFEIKVQR